MHVLKQGTEEREGMGGALIAFQLLRHYDSPAPHASLSTQIQVTFLGTQDLGKLAQLLNTGHFPLNHIHGHGKGILIMQGTVTIKGCFPTEGKTRGEASERPLKCQSLSLFQ